jgi:hypothetical protein
MPERFRRDPARLLPVDPTVRAIALDLYARAAEVPITSPHGHVPPSLLLHDEPYADPVALLLTADRCCHTQPGWRSQHSHRRRRHRDRALGRNRDGLHSRTDCGRTPFVVVVAAP